MTSMFSWQNSVSLGPASFCTTRPNLPIILGITGDSVWAPAPAFLASLVPPLTRVSAVFHPRGKVCPWGTGMRPSWFGASRDADWRHWWATWCLNFWAVTPPTSPHSWEPPGLLVPPAALDLLFTRWALPLQNWGLRGTRAANSCESLECLPTSLSPSWPLLGAGGEGEPCLTNHHIWACLQYCPCYTFLASCRYRCILPYCDEDGGPLHQLKMWVDCNSRGSDSLPQRAARSNGVAGWAGLAESWVSHSLDPTGAKVWRASPRKEERKPRGLWRDLGCSEEHLVGQRSQSAPWESTLIPCPSQSCLYPWSWDPEHKAWRASCSLSGGTSAGVTQLVLRGSIDTQGTAEPSLVKDEC